MLYIVVIATAFTVLVMIVLLTMMITGTMMKPVILTILVIGTLIQIVVSFIRVYFYVVTYRVQDNSACGRNQN